VAHLLTSGLLPPQCSEEGVDSLEGPQARVWLVHSALAAFAAHQRQAAPALRASAGLWSCGLRTQQAAPRWLPPAALAFAASVKAGRRFRQRLKSALLLSLGLAGRKAVSHL
jgi:hypothetical protein